LASLVEEERQGFVALPHTYERYNRQSNFYPALFNASQAQPPDPTTGNLDPNGPGFETVPGVPLSNVVPGARFYMNGIGIAGKNGISGFGGANSAHEHAHPETLRAAIEITKGAQVAVPRTTGVLEVRNDPFAAMSEEELDEYIRSGGIDPATPRLL